jgi:hypothetical protein
MQPPPVENGNELSQMGLVELHPISGRPEPAWQDIRFARIGQEASERFYNHRP